MIYRTNAGKVLSVVGVVLRLLAIFGATIDLIVFFPVILSLFMQGAGSDGLSGLVFALLVAVPFALLFLLGRWVSAYAIRKEEDAE